MSTAVMTNRFELNSVADTVLKTAAGFWFVVAVIGQWAFLYYLVAFYGPSTLTGNLQAWTRNTFLRMSYVRGDTAGNLAFAAHALLASVIAFGGAIQLIPQIRARAINIVGNYACNIDWSDGHSSGIYNFRSLRGECPCDECKALRAQGKTPA